METAKVTVKDAFPLYAVVIPTAKKTIANIIAIEEIMTTKLPLFMIPIN